MARRRRTENISLDPEGKKLLKQSANDTLTRFMIKFKDGRRAERPAVSRGQTDLSVFGCFGSAPSAGAVAAVLKDALLEERRELADGVFGEPEAAVGVGSERRAGR